MTFWAVEMDWGEGAPLLRYYGNEGLARHAYDHEEAEEEIVTVRLKRFDLGDNGMFAEETIASSESLKEKLMR